MPLLQEYLQPAFSSIGEAVECFRQLFEVGLPYITLARSLTFRRPFNLCTGTVLPIGKCCHYHLSIYPSIQRSAVIVHPQIS